MDAQNILLQSVFGTADANQSFARPATALPPAVAAPDLQAEVDEIIVVVPRALRENARWAIPLLLATARTGGITHLRRIAYVLAAAQHCSSFGGALVETPARTDDAESESFCGRGFVRVRGRAAYAAWSKRLGMPDHHIDGAAVPFFVAHPNVLARPNIAAQILIRGMRDGMFTGIALGSFVNDKRTDFHNAHRVIDCARNAREIALTATAFAAAIERVHGERHEARMLSRSRSRNAELRDRDVLSEVRDAVARLAARGEIMPEPHEVIDWNGEARQGKFVQLDHQTCALHLGRGTYVQLDVQRDLNGIVPPEGRNMALKRSGEVQPTVRHGSVNSWR